MNNFQSHKQMKIVTVCTHAERYFPCLVESLKRFNETLVILEWGKKWTGYRQKLSAMLNYLKTIDAEEIVCFIDAYDVILLQSPSELERRFKASKSKMIIAKDGQSPNLVVQYFIQNGFPNVHCVPTNSGTYIAYAGHLLKLLTEIEQSQKKHPSKSNNDQEIIAKWCQTNEGWLDVDVNCELFLTFYTGSRWSFSNKLDMEKRSKEIAFAKNKQTKRMELFYKPTKTFPAVLHAPGDGDINPIIKRLGLSIPKPMIDQRSMDRLKYLWKNTKAYVPMMWQEMIPIALIIVLVLCILVLSAIVGVRYVGDFIRQQ